ncbi:MAG: NADH-quinone oxidoreductase subunit K [Phycisphaerales bacterium]
MTLLLAITIGAMYATAVYLILRRSIVKLLIGLSMLAHGGNLLVFVAGGLAPRGESPLIRPTEKVLREGTQDPIPEALVLTAIVIGFGVLAFALTLFKQAYNATGTDDVQAMQDPAA